MNYLPLLGRIFFSAIFILASFSHFTRGAIQMAYQQEVPLAIILVPLSGIIAFLGGVSILVGYRAKIGAGLIILFLIPVTLMMHKFWAFQDPISAMNEKLLFMKNLSMLGGAIFIAYFGSGPFSHKR